MHGRHLPLSRFRSSPPILSFLIYLSAFLTSPLPSSHPQLPKVSGAASAGSPKILGIFRKVVMQFHSLAHIGSFYCRINVLNKHMWGFAPQTFVPRAIPAQSWRLWTQQCTVLVHLLLLVITMTIHMMTTAHATYRPRLRTTTCRFQ